MNEFRAGDRVRYNGSRGRQKDGQIARIAKNGLIHVLLDNFSRGGVVVVDDSCLTPLAEPPFPLTQRVPA